ncbi:hypothetical protein Y032_0009g396 [Ancylostoma ceylanicum]|uniref:Uncharacterized protein n=1 Tax=Ancylostoma ceylanicum TaxID=53326 RepID=A0A016VGV8_9BILA|nr:hypothetical protein Y032_0009g396 [Ancylostoma ceylanicum]
MALGCSRRAMDECFESVRTHDFEEDEHPPFNNVKHEDMDEASYSNAEGDLELDLHPHAKKSRREYPAGRFLKKELEYIAKTYCDNYKTFYYSTVNGGKDKDCIARKKALLVEMAEHISALGDEPRTVEQVEQKIRDEMKRVKKYLIAKKHGRQYGKREIVLSSPQQMIADMIEQTTLEPFRQKIYESHGVEDPVAVDTSNVDMPAAGSSLEVSPRGGSQRATSPPVLRNRKRKMSDQRDEMSRDFVERSAHTRRDFDFEGLKCRRRTLEEDLRYARAKLEAVTAERDFWMAKIDVLDLERQYWMSELERNLRERY